MLKQELLLDIAKKIDHQNETVEVMELFGIKSNAPLFFQQAEHVFQNKASADYEENFSRYLNNLKTAHKEMMVYICDPTNKELIMEENPIHSKDLNHGVPIEFRELLEEIINPDAFDDNHSQGSWEQGKNLTMGNSCFVEEDDVEFEKVRTPSLRKTVSDGMTVDKDYSSVGAMPFTGY